MEGLPIFGVCGICESFVESTKNTSVFFVVVVVFCFVFFPHFQAVLCFSNSIFSADAHQE